jgi:hypothetical protein
MSAANLHYFWVGGGGWGWGVRGWGRRQQVRGGGGGVQSATEGAARRAGGGGGRQGAHQVRVSHAALLDRHSFQVTTPAGTGVRVRVGSMW